MSQTATQQLLNPTPPFKPAEIEFSLPTHPRLRKMIEQGIPCSRVFFNRAVNDGKNAPQNCFSVNYTDPARVGMRIWYCQGEGVLTYHVGVWIGVTPAIINSYYPIN